jgi:hypothetical protein
MMPILKRTVCVKFTAALNILQSMFRSLVRPDAVRPGPVGD